MEDYPFGELPSAPGNVAGSLPLSLEPRLPVQGPCLKLVLHRGGTVQDQGDEDVQHYQVGAHEEQHEEHCRGVIRDRHEPIGHHKPGGEVPFLWGGGLLVFQPGRRIRILA